MTQVAAKRYYAKVKNSRFVFEDGTEVLFINGYADIYKEKHKQELDAILNKNPNIYVPDTTVEPLPTVQQNAKSAAEIATQDAVLAKAAGANFSVQQEVGPVMVNNETPDIGQGPVANVNISSIDPDLQAAMLNSTPKVIGPGASAAEKVAAIRQNAAASISTK